MLILSSPPLLITMMSDFGSTDRALLLLASLAGVAILLYSYLVRRRTRYYLTDERIIEVHEGHIVKEIPLEHFAGRTIGQFLES